jgi:hypothetical protein
MAEEKKDGKPEQLPETDAKAVAKRAAEILEEVNRVGDDLKVADAKRAEELAKYGKATEATGAEVEAHGAKIGELQAELKKLTDDVNEKLGRLSAPGGGRVEQPMLSLGQSFIRSDAYKRYRDNGGAKESATHVVEDGLANMFGRRPALPMVLSEQVAGVKATLATTEATRLIPHVRLDMVTPGERPLSLLDLIPTTAYAGGGVEYMEEVGFHDGTPVNPSGGAGTWAGGYITITDTAHGVREGQLVQIASADPAALDGLYRAQVLTADTFRISVPADPTLVDIGTYQIMRLHGAATQVAEGSNLPEASYKIERRLAAEGEIGHFLPITQQLREDDSRLAAMIDMRMAFGVEKGAERAALYGTGSSPQYWEGILQRGRLAEWLWSRGATSPVPDTKIDAIRRGLTVVGISEYPATGVVLSLEDNQDLDLVKGTDGHYIYLRAVGDGAGNRFFALPRVEVHTLAPGEALVGAFALASAIYLRREVQIDISDSHNDYFQKRLLAVRAYMRGAFEVTRPEAFVKITFDSAPVAST